MLVTFLSQAATYLAAKADEDAAELQTAPYVITKLSLHVHLISDPRLPCFYLPPPRRFFGPLESVRVFPEKTFAFVNYISAVHAAAAKLQLDGLPAGSVTGGKQLVIRFQRDVLILPGLGLGHGTGRQRPCSPRHTLASSAGTKV